MTARIKRRTFLGSRLRFRRGISHRGRSSATAFVLAGAASYLKDNGKEGLFEFLKSINFEERISHAIGHGWFQILGVAAFAVMGAILFKVALKPVPKLD